MAKQTINQGTAPTGAGGDTFRTGSAKLQANDNELYAQLGATAEGALPEALPLKNGGTGATTAEQAREKIGVYGKGELGLGINLRAGLNVSDMAGLNPEQVNSLVAQGTGNIGYDGMHYHASSGSTVAGFPEPYGALHGYTVDQNNFSYSYQVFTGLTGGNHYIRYATSRTTWSPFKKIMLIGDSGIGAQSNPIPYAQVDQKNSTATYNGFWSAIEDGSNLTAGITASYSSDWFVQIKWSVFNGLQWREFTSGNTFNHWKKIYHSGNTTVDSNGFVKAASPIIKLFADKIELNDEAEQQDIVFEKLGIGDYLIKGSSGFTQEGWYIETPKDANGNVLFSVIYITLENGDISVKTYKKKFDFETVSIVADLDNPVDITESRWIDLRLQELPQPEIEVAESIAPPDFQPAGLAEAVATVMESYNDPEQ